MSDESVVNGQIPLGCSGIMKVSRSRRELWNKPMVGDTITREEYYRREESGRPVRTI